MSLSQNIKLLRLKNDLTQEQLAEVLGVSPQAVSKWETSDTYPDGTLLVPLAKALGTSLDELFDNDSASMASVSSHIIRKLKQTPFKNRFEAAREICWQIEKGLFSYDTAYAPNEYRCVKNSSYILGENGFTIVSNGQSPFFSVFTESEVGFGETIGDGEEMRKICQCLADPHTMRAVIFLHKNEPELIFDAEFLARECSIGNDDIDRVTEALCELRVASKKEVNINGRQRVLYSSNPSHKLIALFIVAHEMNYTGGYSLQAGIRKKPYLK